MLLKIMFLFFYLINIKYNSLNSRLCPEACTAPLGPFLQKLKDLQIPSVETTNEPEVESPSELNPTQKYLR